MTIELTKEQYKSLLRIAFLGYWVANSFRHDLLDEFEEIEQHIMTFASQVDVDDMVGYDKKLKRWFPTKEMELAMHELIDEYNNDFFWEELVERLARRDVLEKYGDKYKVMTVKERIRADSSFIDKYSDEFQKYGIQNLGIIPGRKDDLSIN